jgi:hypothetical protein
MTAPAIIHDLVNRFRDSRELYRSGRYNEAQLRQEFLNPLFETLGWDMYNRSNFAPQYREVIHEDSLEDEGSLKAPDYAFRIGTTRKFFVEAKKPAVDIRYAIHPAYQLRRYAWNAHLPLSILTDFEELAVYDCRTRPDPQDSAATGRVMLFTFEDYLTRWDELAQIFSKDAVWNGSFDRYAEGSKGKRGTTEVDAEFLKEIEQWRLLLARNIALRNFRASASDSIVPASSPSTTPDRQGSNPATIQSLNLHRAERQLNYAVQTTIDRILFLRICEDRKIEPTDQLLQIAEGSDIYTHLLKLFQKADQKYNSGLFHFNKEKSQTSEPDSFTPTLQIDDKVLRQVIKSTYYPCPYMFNEIPVEILGQVYEQFLGSVIRLTPGGQAKVEEKPEVRKAGGVYYTPRYIVDYIVENTVGRLLCDSCIESEDAVKPSLWGGEVQPQAGSVSVANGGEGDTEETIRSKPVLGLPTNASGVGVLRKDSGTIMTPAEALKLRVVDPACGSGSFLLGAYQYLLDWHLNYYLTHDPQSHTQGKNPPLVAAEGGEYRLTTDVKKRILTANIHGVDIDAQAVEVTKLSLLLKLLEGETGQLTLGFERVLPDLGQNIRCGNSLIGWDYFQGALFPDEEEIQRVNPFDWQRAFPHVFAEGGFDAVIGNPPYIRIQSIREWAPNYVEHYRKIFPSASTGNFDIYVIFIEKGLSLLNESGFLGFILPHKFFQAAFAAPIREIISQGNHLSKVVHFGAEQVFANATTYTCLLFLSAQPKENFEFTSIKSLEAIETTLKALDACEPNPDYETAILPVPPAGGKEWHFSSNNAHIVLEKLRQQPLTLGDITKKIFVGLQTSADKIYVLEKIEERDETVLCYSKSLQKEVEIERSFLKPFLMGKDVHRYEQPDYRNFVIFPYHIDSDSPSLMNQKFIRSNFPLGWNYLLENKNALGDREKGRMKGDQFYAYIYPKSLIEFKNKKIMTPDIAYGPQFTYDDFGLYHTTTVYSLLFNNDRKESSLYFLGILNSTVMWFFLSNTGNVMRGGYFRYKTNYLTPFPIPVVDFSDQTSVARHDQLVALVKNMLQLKNSDPKLPQDKLRKQEAIISLDAQINRLVFQLYSLESHEARIILSISD